MMPRPSKTTHLQQSSASHDKTIVEKQGHVLPKYVSSVARQNDTTVHGKTITDKLVMAQTQGGMYSFILNTGLGLSS